ncbi:MAG: hypothetical protein I4O49_06130 [Janthinobacterium lividum]|nr:hypothetical protein [Janthinobacterium lividum]
MGKLAVNAVNADHRASTLAGQADSVPQAAYAGNSLLVSASALAALGMLPPA